MSARTAPPTGQRLLKQATHLMIPPSAQLSQFIYSKGNYDVNVAKQAQHDRYINKRRGRLPLLAIQRLARRSDGPDPEQWHERLEDLAEPESWSEEEIQNWTLILKEEEPDVLIERLVNSTKTVPLFLAMWALNRRQVIRNPKSVIDLLRWFKRYINTNNCQSDQHWRQIPHKVFLDFLDLLVAHIRRLCPGSFLSAAKLTADYILYLSHTKNGFEKQCHTFNGALVIFCRPAHVRPLSNSMYNWSAQKTLLALSDSLEKPLIIDRASYRAIRQTMISQHKSKAETGHAIRYGLTWPPYRQQLDGMDAKQSPEDYHSDSIKVGILAREAGYSDTHLDHAQTVLGGMDADDTPTIQTRLPLPDSFIKSRIYPPKNASDADALEKEKRKLRKAIMEKKNKTMYWSMRIRATRNAHEAWARFRQAPFGHALHFYAEMFRKLFAKPVPAGAQALPGDTRENFPFHNANYSEYELARMAPPTVKTLYEDMIRAGIKPEGHCLTLLVANALTIEDGLQYLRDSGVSEDNISALSMSTSTVPTSHNLRKINARDFTSYIELLCKLQPNRRHGEEIPEDSLQRIQHAAFLVNIRFRPGTNIGKTYRPPWLWIFRELSRPHIAVKNGTRLENDLRACDLFVKVLYRAVRAVGMDADMFMYLCRMTQKVSRTRMASDATLEDSADYIPIQITTEKLLADMFVTMTTATPAQFDRFGLVGKRHRTLTDKDLMQTDYADPALKEACHRITPSHLHAYMRSLAFWGKVHDMVQLFKWIVRNRGQVEREALWQGTKRGPEAIKKTLRAFQALAGPHLEPSLLADLDKLLSESESSPEGADRGLDSYWRWSTPEEIQDYICRDETGGTAMLASRRAPPMGTAHPAMAAQEGVEPVLEPEEADADVELENEFSSFRSTPSVDRDISFQSIAEKEFDQR